MKVLFNASILKYPRTGIGKYTFELSKALSQIDGLRLLCFDGVNNRENSGSITPRGVSSRFSYAARLIPGAYRMRRMLMRRRFAGALKSVNPDIYHEPTLWPFEVSIPSVMTVHDLTHLHYPETQPKARIAEIERRFDRAMSRVAVILVDSNHVANELSQYYGVSKDRIVVAHLGVSHNFQPYSAQQLEPSLQKLGLTLNQYLLSVGTLEPRKNLSFVIQSHQLLPRKVRLQYPLVIAGMAGWRCQQIHAEFRSGVNEGSIRILGYLDDDLLAHVISGARMLAYLSLYEGFGLPVLEAMASGTPVMVSRRAALPEVAGEAGYYVELDNAEACAQSMLHLIEDDKLWVSHRSLGLARATLFNWSTCAEKTLAAYRQALAG